LGLRWKVGAGLLEEVDVKREYLSMRVVWRRGGEAGMEGDFQVCIICLHADIADRILGIGFRFRFEMLKVWRCVDGLVSRAMP
jgi:hypothetical protein